MIYVEGGTFVMGTGDPSMLGQKDVFDHLSSRLLRHEVTLSSYAIGKYEVTQALWIAVMGSNPSQFKGDDLPVESVSWDDCQEFLKRLNEITGKNFRLPTEAEWKFAARGGKKSKGYKYSGSDNIDDVAWYSDNSNTRTHPVGTKKPNELGLYDMSGNVSEWCQDQYGDYCSSLQTFISIRAGRGGCWFNDAKDCRSSSSLVHTPNYSYIDLGFRLALSE